MDEGTDELPVWRRRGVELPERVARLLLGLVADGFTLRCCGPRDNPAALVASYEWDSHVDLVTIRDFDRQVNAARIPKHSRPVDVFAPDTVVWFHQGAAADVLTSLLELVHPDHPAAPTTMAPAPISLYVPRREQRPMTIRLPTPERASSRAARLGAQLPSAANKEIAPGSSAQSPNWCDQRSSVPPDTAEPNKVRRSERMAEGQIVACAVIGSEDDVLMTQQLGGGWALPCARVGQGERVEAALDRSVREVLGVGVDSASFLCLIEDPDGLFVVFDVTPEAEDDLPVGENRPELTWVGLDRLAALDLQPAALRDALQAGEPPPWLPWQDT